MLEIFFHPALELYRDYSPKHYKSLWLANSPTAAADNNNSTNEENENTPIDDSGYHNMTTVNVFIMPTDLLPCLSLAWTFGEQKFES